MPFARFFFEKIFFFNDFTLFDGIQKPASSRDPWKIQGCQIFLGPNIPKWEMTTNYT
jgi:hypothetical protein